MILISRVTVGVRTWILPSSPITFYKASVELRLLSDVGFMFFWWRLLPGLPGRASEVERQVLKFLQLNLGRGKDTQDLLMKTARERGADVLLISEQHKWSENSSWFQVASKRAGILVCSPDLRVEDFLESDVGFF